jgi:hypothetical protein
LQYVHNTAIVIHFIYVRAALIKPIIIIQIKCELVKIFLKTSSVLLYIKFTQQICTV